MKINWDAVGAIAESVGAIGVILSIIYVGLQMAQNTKAVRGQIHESQLNAYMSLVNLVCINSTIWEKGIKETNANLPNLTSEEKIVFFNVFISHFKTYEYLFRQYRSGNINISTWDSWSQQIKVMMQMPIIKAVWEIRKNMYYPKFQEYISSINNADIPDVLSLSDEV